MRKNIGRDSNPDSFRDSIRSASSRLTSAFRAFTAQAVDSKHCEAQIFKPPRKDPSKEEEEDDDACSYISEGEPRERSELVSWGKSHRGSWWRVRSNLREELIVRAGVSLSSVEIGRSVAGDVFQQKGKPRMLLEKRGEGCIRMPIQPTGWITADASRAGGPQYLIRIHSPQWKAVYDAGGQDILVRASVELDSEVVATLSCGDIVEQDGPVTTVHWGIVRMPIVVKSGRQNGDSQRIVGWVTTDASAASGPVFFKLMPEVENQKRGRR
ncbi:unnamed protein product [Durusdinium trenchii]|uniref:Uncharacterized protein n=1 Tax=Durusdinium trenchii TaxID=1381693 RepID=A0ABP0MKF1_9DINO